MLVIVKLLYKCIFIIATVSAKGLNPKAISQFPRISGDFIYIDTHTHIRTHRTTILFTTDYREIIEVKEPHNP